MIVRSRGCTYDIVRGVHDLLKVSRLGGLGGVCLCCSRMIDVVSYARIPRTTVSL